MEVANAPNESLSIERTGFEPGTPRLSVCIVNHWAIVTSLVLLLWWCHSYCCCCFQHCCCKSNFIPIQNASFWEKLDFPLFKNSALVGRQVNGESMMSYFGASREAYIRILKQIAKIVRQLALQDNVIIHMVSTWMIVALNIQAVCRSLLLLSSVQCFASILYCYFFFFKTLIIVRFFDYL